MLPMISSLLTLDLQCRGVGIFVKKTGSNLNSLEMRPHMYVKVLILLLCTSLTWLIYFIKNK